MPPLTDFLRTARGLETAIHTATADKPNGTERATVMLQEMLRLAVLTDEPSSLRKLGKPYEAFSRVVRREHNRIAMGMAGYFTRDISAHDLHRRRVISLREFRYLNELSAKCGAGLHQFRWSVPEPILAELDFWMENVELVLEKRAFEDLLLAALESYSVSAEGRGRRYTEAYGLCFGNHRVVKPRDPTLTSTRTVTVSRVVTQLRARATANSVIPNEKSGEVLQRFSDRFIKGVDLVGDYHTHPYRTSALMRRERGWELSDVDREQLVEWVASIPRERVRPVLSLVVAVSRASRNSEAKASTRRNQIVLRTCGCDVRIGAYRLLTNGDAEPVEAIHFG